MSAQEKDREMRYTPKSPQAAEVLALMREYESAFTRADAAANALARWSMAFLNIEPGVIVEASKRLAGPTAIYVPTFTMRGVFTGWKGNAHRMLVEKVQICNNQPLVHLPFMQVQLIGVPLKNDDTPFKGATCSVTLDILDHASTVNYLEESGYPGYFRDTVARYVDVTAEKTVASAANPT